MLTKPPRSSFFDRNMDMIASVYVVRYPVSVPFACLSLLYTAVMAALMEQVPSGISRSRDSRLGNLDGLHHCFFCLSKTHSPTR